jgi:hypothetical protein
MLASEKHSSLLQLGNGSICLGINYSVLMRWNGMNSDQILKILGW